MCKYRYNARRASPIGPVAGHGQMRRPAGFSSAAPRYVYARLPPYPTAAVPPQSTTYRSPYAETMTSDSSAAAYTVDNATHHTAMSRAPSQASSVHSAYTAYQALSPSEPSTNSRSPLSIGTDSYLDYDLNRLNFPSVYSGVYQRGSSIQEGTAGGLFQAGDAEREHVAPEDYYRRSYDFPRLYPSAVRPGCSFQYERQPGGVSYSRQDQCGSFGSFQYLRSSENYPDRPPQQLRAKKGGHREFEPLQSGAAHSNAVYWADNDSLIVPSLDYASETRERTKDRVPDTYRSNRACTPPEEQFSDSGFSAERQAQGREGHEQYRSEPRRHVYQPSHTGYGDRASYLETHAAPEPSSADECRSNSAIVEVQVPRGAQVRVVLTAGKEEGRR